MSVPVEAQALRKHKRTGARRNHLNFALPDISSSIIYKEGSGYSMLVGRYKQSGGEDGVMVYCFKLF